MSEEKIIRIDDYSGVSGEELLDFLPNRPKKWGTIGYGFYMLVEITEEEELFLRLKYGRITIYSSVGVIADTIIGRLEDFNW